MTSVRATTPWPGGSYALRPVVVVLDLSDLHGPLTGCLELPVHLNASAARVFDFSQPGDRAAAYQLVLLEAATADDLTRWIDPDELRRMWPDLYLPRAVRQAWQDAHPQLRALGASSHVPQV
jgi:hypothetical protein